MRAAPIARAFGVGPSDPSPQPSPARGEGDVSGACPREGKWIGGCKFEGRFDVSPANLSQFSEISRMTAAFANTLRKETYVRDVCIRCGRTIERK